MHFRDSWLFKWNSYKLTLSNLQNFIVSIISDKELIVEGGKFTITKKDLTKIFKTYFSLIYDVSKTFQRQNGNKEVEIKFENLSSSNGYTIKFQTPSFLNQVFFISRRMTLKKSRTDTKTYKKEKISHAVRQWKFSLRFSKLRLLLTSETANQRVPAFRSAKFLTNASKMYVNIFN